MRLDSHQHFWIYNNTDYVWMSDDMDGLRRDYLPSELRSHLTEIGFDGSIAVQARQQEQETEWLLELANSHDFIQGVVGWIDFLSPRLEESLERFANNKKLKGVRELIHDMPNDDYAISPIHTRAISQLAQYGLTYDLLLKPKNLPAANQLVRWFPDQPFVVDHVAKPRISGDLTLLWRGGIQSLAECENVYCKLSGMVTEAAWQNWKPSDFRPYLDFVLETFGPQRVMIGSDWPVCTLSGSYQETMNIVIDYVSELTSSESQNVLGRNAAMFYHVTQVDVPQHVEKI